MSMMNRLRNRRDAARRARAIERALNSTRSEAVRDEIRAIATRQFG
jgi:hypothetical protein